jgi:hypothetical protein
VFANDAMPGPAVERACKLIEMDGMQIHRRRRRMQFILVLCGLAILFGLYYLLLMHSIPS